MFAKKHPQVQISVIELSKSKENYEIVGWRIAPGGDIERIKKRAIKEGGHFLINDPKGKVSADLSDLQDDSNLQKLTHRTLIAQEKATEGRESLKPSKDKKQEKLYQLKEFRGKGTKSYIPQDGQEVRYNTLSDSGTVSEGTREVRRGLWRRTCLQYGEYSAFEVKYRKHKSLQFFQDKEEVKTPEDVAFIFRQLEQENVEHAIFLGINAMEITPRRTGRLLLLGN